MGCLLIGSMCVRQNSLDALDYKLNGIDLDLAKNALKLPAFTPLAEVLPI